MGAYTTQFWGISLTEKYGKIEDAMPSLDPESYEGEGDDVYDLGSYIEHHELGESMYDGGGWGQITFLGLEIEPGPRGIVVTDEHVEKVAAIIARIPDELKQALTKVYGIIPEPAFHTEEGSD